MMKKCMLKQTISWLFLCMLLMAVAAQAEVIYEDTFDGDGLGTNTGIGSNGMINNTIRSHSWSDSAATEPKDLIYNAGAGHQLSRAYVYTADAFQSGGGFKLTVYYTVSSTALVGANKFEFGLVSADTIGAIGVGPFQDLKDPIYGIGVAVTDSGGPGLFFKDGTTTTTVLDNSQTFIVGTSTEVVIEIGSGGAWSYSINGAPAISGTIAGGFDLDRSYHAFAFGRDNETAKSIQSVKLETRGAGGAHSPAPTGNAVDHTVLDPDNPGQISWQGPVPYSPTDPNSDPNVVSVDQYDITYYIVNTDDVAADDPNWLTKGVTIPDVASPYTIPAPGIDFDQTMFWRVDTTVTWDSNELTGTASLTSIVEGSDWKFSTVPEYTLPVLESFDNVITTMDLLPAALAATITGNSDPLNASFTVLEDDIEFPVGATYTFVPDVSDVQNPMATLEPNQPGTYHIKLEIDDGVTFLEGIAEVVVYADEDACQAQKDAPSGWTAHLYDFDGNCYVDLLDFAEIAAAWLDDTTMDSPETYTGSVNYVPQAVYDIRYEAEWVDPNDPNACSDGPISDLIGVQIQVNEGASGGQNIGNNGGGSWIDYMIDVPALAVGVPVDVYIGYGLSGTLTRTVSFGTEGEGNEALYGTTEAQGSGDWYNFVGSIGGPLTFTVSGPQEVRVTCSNSLNLDWFSFDWPE